MNPKGEGEGMGERIEGKMGKEGRDKEMLSFFYLFIFFLTE